MGVSDTDESEAEAESLHEPSRWLSYKASVNKITY